jgi:hypothetical protein
MNGGKQLLDKIEIQLRDRETDNLHTVYIDVHDSSLSHKWLGALNVLIDGEYHLEKNFCFVGFTEHNRTIDYILKSINTSINAINDSPLDYQIDDNYTRENTIMSGIVSQDTDGGKLIHERFNMLHRYFEDLQGTSGDGGKISNHYNSADIETRWHIRQLNLLCHEYESLALSERKKQYLPEWQRPSQLMCYMSAPRFELDENDYELFGIDTLSRPLGAVYVGVNKAVGKHHWEVFQDEGGRDIDKLTTSTLRPQSQAAGDFDIEWANNPGEFDFMKIQLREFREWLVNNGFNPKDKSLTIGHPQVGQVNLINSFGSENYIDIWKVLNKHLDVFSIKTSDSYVEYTYSWSDDDYMKQQIRSVR